MSSQVEPTPNNDRVALVSMPWALYNRPSIQLGSLKAFLEKQGDIQVDALHPYLDIAKKLGADIYHTISQKSWAGEALFSALLFPEKLEDAKALFTTCFKPSKYPWADYNQLTANVEETIEVWLKKQEFDNYHLVGFSVCFDQLLSSLYAAKWIKKHHPNLPIVFGGSSCCGLIGKSLVDTFDQIDFVIDGEGEQPLLALLQNVTGKKVPLPTSILTKEFDKVQANIDLNQLDLNSLPTPNYADYFNQLPQIFPEQPFLPIIPIEFSRGCWWSKCTFCNLNIQWCGYRFKKAEKTAGEITEHCQRYDCLDFTFTDNALPPKEADRFFEAVANQEKDFRFFAEIRAITSPEKLENYSKGGLNGVQVGIESLSNSLLQKMVKGMSAIENIAIMKYCSANAIQLDGNLIIGFPSSSQQEVNETIENLDFVLPFNPLSTAKFFLGHGSPIQQDPKSYGISPVHHKNYRALFPKKEIANLHCLIQDYRGDKSKQQKMWKAVENKVAAWHLFHTSRKDSQRFPLSYRDGGNFLNIRQEVINRKPLRHKLKGLSREIYLLCEEIQSIDDILTRFPTLSEEALHKFLKGLHQKRILFLNNGHALSLAIHQP